MPELPTHTESRNPAENDLAIGDRSRFRGSPVSPGSPSDIAITTDLGKGMTQITYIDGYAAPTKPKVWR